MDPELQHDVALALALVTAAQLAAALASKLAFLPTAPDLKKRYEASDAVLLPPLFAAVGSAACVAAWELRGSVAHLVGALDDRLGLGASCTVEPSGSGAAQAFAEAVGAARDLYAGVVRGKRGPQACIVGRPYK